MFNLKNRLLNRVSLETTGVGQEQQVQDEKERIQEATCVILLEVAQSDEEFSSIEKATLTALLEKEFDIPQDAIEELINIARQKREKSVGLWEFTNLINENYSTEEKLKIMEAAWRIIYADSKLDMYEDHLIHRLAKLLRLDHKELIKAKLKVLEEV